MASLRNKKNLKVRLENWLFRRYQFIGGCNLDENLKKQKLSTTFTDEWGKKEYKKNDNGKVQSYAYDCYFMSKYLFYSKEFRIRVFFSSIKHYASSFTF